MIANKLTPTEIKPQPSLNPSLVTDYESDDINNKKRKRKSRWANDTSVSPLIGVPPVTIGQTIPQPVNVQKLGNFSYIHYIIIFKHH